MSKMKDCAASSKLTDQDKVDLNAKIAAVRKETPNDSPKTIVTSAVGLLLADLRAELSKYTATKPREVLNIYKEPTTDPGSIAYHTKQNKNAFINTVADIISKFKTAIVSLATEKLGQLSAKETTALENFAKFTADMDQLFNRKYWGGVSFFPEVDQVVDKKFSDQKLPSVGQLNADLSRQLLDESGKPTDTYKAALIYAAYEAILDLANNKILTTSQVATMLGVSKDELLANTYKKYASIGVSPNSAYNRWGNTVMQVLGITTNKSNEYSPDMVAKLKASLGGQVLQLLRASGYIQVNFVSENDYLLSINKEVTDQDSSNRKFFYQLSDKRKADVDKIKEANKGSAAVVSRLLDTERFKALPSLKPIDQVPTTTDTGQSVPRLIQESLKAFQRTPFVIKEQQLTLLKELEAIEVNNLNLAQIIFGLKSEEEIALEHPVNKKGMEAANAALLRDWDELNEVIDLYGDAVFKDGIYLKSSVWKMNRSGITSTINPTAKKIHRYLLAGKDWFTTIKFDDKDQIDLFTLRVAEGFGIATDKKSNQTSLNKFNEFVQQHEKAIENFANWVKDSNTQLDAQGLVELLNAAELKGGEKVKTFDALVQYANYINAKAAYLEGISDVDAFVTSIMGEVDGVSNGPILTLLMLGISAGVEPFKDFFAKGGFFTDNQTSWNVWREIANNIDLYESVHQYAQNVITKSISSANNKNKSVYNAIWYFDGKNKDDTSLKQFTNRSSIKGGTNPIIFGSSPKNATNSMFVSFIDSIYSRIAQVYHMPDSQEKTQETNNIKRALYDLGLKEIGKVTINDLYTNELDKKELSTLKSSYDLTIGKDISNALSEYFEEFLSARSVITELTTAVADVYTLEKAKLVEQAEKDLGIEYTKGVINVGLSQATLDSIEDKLNKMGLKPVLPTYLSTKENNPDAGLLMLKKEKGLTLDPLYQTQLTGNQPFVTGYNKYHTGVAESFIESDPGVLGVSVPTHSTDASISLSTGLELSNDGISSFNMHDSRGTGLSGMVAIAKELNKQTFQSLMQYGHFVAVVKMGLNTLRGVTFKHAPLNDAVKNAIDARFNATKNKLNFLVTVTNVNQYVLENAHYVVTAQDKAAIAQLLKDNQTLYEAQVKEFNELVKKQTEQETQVETVKPEVQEITEQVPEEITPVNIDPNVRTIATVFANQIKNKLPIPLSTVLEQVSKLNTNPAYKTLLGLLANKNVNVYLLNDISDIPNEQHRKALSETPNAYGHFYDNTVYVYLGKNPKDVVTIFHESVHAVITNHLHQIEYFFDKFSAEEQQTYKNIQAVMFHPKVQALKGQFAAAFENLDEFVTYALTSVNFQKALSNVYLTDVDTKKLKTYYRNTAFNYLVEQFATLFNKVFKIGDFRNKENKNALMLVIAEGANLIEQSKTGTVITAPVARSMAMQLNGLQTYDTAELFDLLADPAKPLNAPTSDYLKKLVGGIANTVYGPYGTFKAALMENTPSVADDVLAIAENTDVAPLAKAMHASLNMSAQERFAADQVGMTVEAIISNPDNYHALRTLQRIYTQAQRDVTPDMLATGTSIAEQQEAKDLYNFIFNSSQTNGQALARFVGLGLTNEKVTRALGNTFTSLATVKVKNNLFSKLQEWFTTALNYINRKMYGVYNGQPLDASLRNLVTRLVRNELQAQSNAKKTNKLDKITNAADTALNYVAKKAIKAVDTAGRSKLVAGLPVVGSPVSNSLKLAADVAQLTMNGKLENVLDRFMRARDLANPNKYGVTAGLVNEIIGEKNSNTRFYRLLQLTKQVEQQREERIKQASQVTESTFADNGAKLTKETRKAISSLLRTGIGQTSYTAQQVSDFLNNAQSLDKELDDLLSNIKKFAGTYQNLIKYQADALAYFSATGINKSKIGLALNANNIAEMIGTNSQGKLKGVKPQLVPLLESYVSLKAIKDLRTNDLKELKQVTREETQRGTDNGIAFTLAYYKKLHEQAKKDLFNNKPELMQHGYLPEIVNPNVDVKTVNGVDVAAANKDANKYLKAGYSDYGFLPAYAGDPRVGARKLLVHKNLPETRRLTGLFSVIDNAARGTELHDGVTGIFGAYGLQINQSVKAQHNKFYNQISSGSMTFDPINTDTQLVPLVNESGDIVNYRYEASHEFRDSVLERDNDFTQLLGKYSGTIYEKPATAKQGETIVQALKDIFDKDYKGHEYRYVLVGPNSLDKEYQEAYRLLPNAAKQAIKNIWGSDDMFVRKDMLDLALGYRKLNVGDAMLKNKANQNMFVKGLVYMYEHLLASGGTPEEKEAARIKGSIQMKQLQKVVSEGVQEIKDIIVLRTGVVLLGNETSNLSLLMLKGVKFVDALKYKVKALEALNVYRAQVDEISKLEAYIDAGFNAAKHDEYRKRIGFLKESIDTNPIKPLIDAGSMPAIVDDVETETNEYSYRAFLANKLETAVNKTGKKAGSAIKTVTNTLYLGPNTSWHKFMAYATQVSDFTSRYALYQHLKKDKSLSEEEILKDVSESFVFYDAPSHRVVEFMNESGLVMFTKYFLRIQKPLIEAIRKNSSRALTMWLLDTYVSGADTVLDSGLTNKLYNPLKYSIFEYPYVLDDIMSMEALSLTLNSK